MTRKARRPDTVTCGNTQCNRTPFSLEQYSCPSPSEHVEESRIHSVTMPVISGWNVQCSKCGHYTVFS
jgi:hypothetical protein